MTRYFFSTRSLDAILREIGPDHALVIAPAPDGWLRCAVDVSQLEIETDVPIRPAANDTQRGGAA